MRSHADCMQQIDWMLDKWEDMAARRGEQDDEEVRRSVFENMFEDDDCSISMAP